MTVARSAGAVTVTASCMSTAQTVTGHTWRYFAFDVADRQGFKASQLEAVALQKKHRGLC